ncbi:MAG: hypothetical protein ACOX4T_09965 [Acetivibrionales bacterium]
MPLDFGPDQHIPILVAAGKVADCISVLILDDESGIGKGLSNIIDWSQLSCEMCGAAADGTFRGQSL